MFIRYLITSASAYAMDLAIYTLLIFFSTAHHWIIANICSKLISSLFSFFAHRQFTFKNQTEQSKFTLQAWRYFALIGLNIPLNIATFSLTLSVIQHPFSAKITTDLCCLYLSYTLSKYKIFTAIP
jgi:putative flippase GtrA